MTCKFIPANDLVSCLQTSRSKGIEQWLAWRVSDGFRFISWIRIVQEQYPATPIWCVYEKCSLDVGSETYIDMDEFEDVGDPDEPEGKRNVFVSTELALAYARELGAKDDRYVEVGGIQYLYREFFNEFGAPEKGADEWFRAA